MTTICLIIDIAINNEKPQSFCILKKYILHVIIKIMWHPVSCFFRVKFTLSNVCLKWHAQMTPAVWVTKPFSQFIMYHHTIPKKIMLWYIKRTNDCSRFEGSFFLRCWINFCDWLLQVEVVMKIIEEINEIAWFN